MSTANDGETDLDVGGQEEAKRSREKGKENKENEEKEEDNEEDNDKDNDEDNDEEGVLDEGTVIPFCSSTRLKSPTSADCQLSCRNGMQSPYRSKPKYAPYGSDNPLTT